MGIAAKIAKTFSQIVRWALIVTPLAIIARWWPDAWRNYPTFLANEKIKIQHQLSDEELKALVPVAREQFKAVGFVYEFKYGDFTKEEINFIGKKMQDWEVLDSCDLLSGFRAVYLKDKSNGEITYAIAGGDLTRGASELLKDADSVFMTTAGDETTQFKDAYNFALQAAEKFGKPNKIVGHSLGGQLAMATAPMFPKSDVFIFDGPGFSYVLRHNLAKFYSDNRLPFADKTIPMSEAKVQECMRGVCRISMTTNAYNTLGSCGIDVISHANPNYNPLHGQWVPVEHFYGMGFFKGMQKPDLQFQNADESRYSSGPLGITAALLLASTAAYLAPSIGRRVGGFFSSKEKDKMAAPTPPTLS